MKKSKPKKFKKAEDHTSKLCCVLAPVGTLYDESICRPCLKSLLNLDATINTPTKDNAANIINILNSFIANEKT